MCVVCSHYLGSHAPRMSSHNSPALFRLALHVTPLAHVRVTHARFTTSWVYVVTLFVLLFVKKMSLHRVLAGLQQGLAASWLRRKQQLLTDYRSE